MSVHRILLILGGALALSLQAQTTVPTVSQAIPAQTLAPGGSASTLDVSKYFWLPGVTGQIVRFDTVLGKFDVELRADAAPQTVANFLGYVQRGDYTNSFFHRSAALETNGLTSIVQGGGFRVNASNQVESVPTQASVPLEYNLPNERGTIAMARSSDINSATSQWYFNVRDDTTVLGPSNGGGYTVFGRVLGTGMTVVDALAALPRVNAGSPFDSLPVRNYTSGNVSVPGNLAMVNSVSLPALFPAASGGASVFTLTAQSSATNVVSVSLSGSTLTLTPVSPGTATITVHATDVNGNGVDNSFSVSVANTPPAFVTQPASQTIAAGNTVVFNASASAAAGYQWQRNGTAISGATNATLVINNASSADAGTYTVVARNAVNSTTSSAATLTVVNTAPADVGRLVNLSIRSNAGTGAQTLIVGFAIGGNGTSGNVPLLLRGVGPSLAQFGLTGALADPVGTMYNGTTVVASNDNWGGDAQVDARAKQVGAFNLTSASSLDAALAVSPAAGSYTMQVTGNGGGTGTALAEIYDATPSASFTATSPRLTNLSARTQVGTADNVLIAGFVVRGSTSKTVLIRATGPALAGFGVTGTLADPKLQLFQVGNATPIAVNDNWGGDPQVTAAASTVGAFPLSNGASTDAALLVTLPPGNYTAQVSGADGGTGVALIEVYEVR